MWRCHCSIAAGSLILACAFWADTGAAADLNYLPPDPLRADLPPPPPPSPPTPCGQVYGCGGVYGYPYYSYAYPLNVRSYYRPYNNHHVTMELFLPRGVGTYGANGIDGSTGGFTTRGYYK